jgi:hypothetical protein
MSPLPVAKSPKPAGLKRQAGKCHVCAISARTQIDVMELWMNGATLPRAVGTVEGADAVSIRSWQRHFHQNHHVGDAARSRAIDVRAWELSGLIADLDAAQEPLSLAADAARELMDRGDAARAVGLVTEAADRALRAAKIRHEMALARDASETKELREALCRMAAALALHCPRRAAMVTAETLDDLPIASAALARLEDSDGA